jgi:hypothetical protein
MGNFWIVPLLHSLSDMTFAKILTIYSTLLQNLNSDGKETRKQGSMGFQFLVTKT